MLEISCVECGNAFEQRFPKHLRCSKACWYKHRYRVRRTQIRASQKRYYDAHQEQRVAYSVEWKRLEKSIRPWTSLLGTAKYRAKKESLLYDLTQEWAASQWNGLCAISHLPFILNQSRSVYSPTIDKIKPELGYVQENCRFVLFGVNALKYNSTDADMYKIAAAITASHMD